MADGGGAMTNDFFISYTGDDEPWAEWIAWQLEAEGYKVVLQAWDFRPGGDFVGHMETAADTSDRTISILSPAYQQAAFAAPEWRVAFAEDPRGDEGKLLPVRVVDFKPSGFFRTRIYIDLVDLDANEARQAIINGVGKERTKPQTEPGFPGQETSTPSVKPRFPGELPPIWNIPYRKNPNFTGRSQLILELREQFAKQGGPGAYEGSFWIGRNR
jgi:hypothetical protein